jgi:triphosphoribosyl-dephospho-CoA synthase
VRASWQASGCNTNLGIVLLAAPIARAAERAAGGELRAAIESELEALDLDDARAAYRAIAFARPGGLGRVAAQDVHAPPGLALREAMALAADRDSIARQYAEGYADLFETGLPAWRAANSDETAAVQRVYLAFLARWPDSHIGRKFNADVAQRVLHDARPWLERAESGAALDANPEFAAWDESLKAAGINPGTSADLTVATLMLGAVVEGRATR